MNSETFATFNRWPNIMSINIHLNKKNKKF